jgi:hypothetical protein
MRGFSDGHDQEPRMKKKRLTVSPGCSVSVEDMNVGTKDDTGSKCTGTRRKKPGKETKRADNNISTNTVNMDTEPDSDDTSNYATGKVTFLFPIALLLSFNVQFECQYWHWKCSSTGAHSR